MGKKSLVFIASFVMWMLLNGQVDVEHVAVGLLAAAFVTYILGDLFISHPLLYREPGRVLRLVFLFVPLLFFSMIKAAFLVAYRILHPDLPIRPGIVRVRTTLKTDTALTLLANAITLTSGTLTVDIDREEGILYVHWVYVEAEDIETVTGKIAGRFEPVIKSIFE